MTDGADFDSGAFYGHCKHGSTYILQLQYVLSAEDSFRGWQKALDLNNEILKEWQEDCSYIALLEMELIKRNIDPPEGEWRGWKRRFPEPDEDYLATLSIDDVLD